MDILFLFLYPLPWRCTSLRVTVLTVFLRLNSCLVLYRCTSLRVTVLAVFLRLYSCLVLYRCTLLRVTVLAVFLRLYSCLVLYRCTLLRVTVLHHYRYLVLERCHKFRLRFYAFTDILYYSDVCLSQVLSLYRYFVLQRWVYVTSLGYDFMPLQIFCTTAMCVCHIISYGFMPLQIYCTTA